MRATALALTATFCCTVAVQGQSTTPADSIMALNRSGKWGEAAAAGERYLASMHVPSAERCTVQGDVIYAEVRLKRNQEAQLQLRRFDQDCREIKLEPGIRREVSSLRRELQQALRRAASDSLPSKRE